MYKLTQLSDEFISKFFKLSVNKLSAVQIESFLNRTDKYLSKYYFTKSSENNLLRILENQFQLNLFISDLIKYDHYLEILLTIVSYSNYLTDILVQNIGYFYLITNPDSLTKHNNKKYFENSIKNIDLTFSSFSSKVNSLRNFKKQEILRIAILDYFLKFPTLKITEQLSLLAATISKYLFSICLDEVKVKRGINRLPNYCLISLGKLGGNELNYSSDIDLILFTESNEQIGFNLYSNKIYEDAVQLFINASSQLTSKGDLYRIDFRLRPYGRNSELVNTIANYLYYYENQSEQWEKQMLIKCNYLGGSKTLFRKFYNYVQNIIYQKTFFISPLEKLKTLKKSIESNSNSEHNIKLASGGIRDIEFAVQALQLLNAGKNPELRQSNTLKAIKKLYKHKLIDKFEYRTLVSNYILFRKIEHFMQLMNNTQTHLLPQSGELLEKIQFFLGYSDSNSFIQDVNERKSFNASFFKQIVNPSDIENEFDKIQFSDKRKAQLNYNFLSTGVGLINSKKFDEATTISFIKISDELIDYLRKAINPDLTLDNFVKLTKSFSIPKYWYDTLRENKLLELTLIICEHSKFLFNILLESQEVREAFISGGSFYKLKQNNFLELNTITFKFYSTLQLFIGLIDQFQFAKLQTEYFLQRIRLMIKENHLTEKYGNDLLILGFGSFASEEMNLFSDIDLVFIINNLDKYPQAQSDCQLLLNDLKTQLKIEIDCRLRPEGKSSPLVWNYYDYIKYIQTRAQSWELHTYTKSTVVWGNKSLYEKLLNSLVDKIKSLDDFNTKKELIEMRNRLVSSSQYLVNLKKVKGGLTDLNFIFGYLCLKYSSHNQNILENSISEKLNFLKAMFDDKDLLDRLINNYFFLKEYEIIYQIVSGSKSVKIDIYDIYFASQSKILKCLSVNELYDKLNRVISENNKIFIEIFK